MGNANSEKNSGTELPQPNVRWFIKSGCDPAHLPEGEVHIWTTRFKDQQEEKALHRCLNREEVARKHSFATAELGKRYMVAHGFLRSTLADYLSCRPKEVQIVTLPWGKPCLLKERLFFNMSHTDKRVVIAVSKDGPVGIDAEEIRLVPEASDIAWRWFSKQEIHWIESQNNRHLAFLHCWVRREALLKAVGLGLGGGMAAFEFTAPPFPFVLRTKTGTIQIHDMQSDGHCVYALATCNNRRINNGL